MTHRAYKATTSATITEDVGELVILAGDGRQWENARRSASSFMEHIHPPSQPLKAPDNEHVDIIVPSRVHLGLRMKSKG